MQKKPNTPALPRLIALCGNPKAGKSLVQGILKENYGVEPIDDGLVLREMAMQHFGATKAHVFSQEGKESPAFWPNGEPIIDVRDGLQMTWRQVLGRLGWQLEAMLGEHFAPMMACNKLPAGGNYSFGSVRRTQGGFYRDRGGVVIEIVNSLAQPSGNDFDCYDPSFITHRIENDGLARGLHPADALHDLQTKVGVLVSELGQKAA